MLKEWKGLTYEEAIDLIASFESATFRSMRKNTDGTYEVSMDA